MLFTPLSNLGSKFLDETTAMETDENLSGENHFVHPTRRTALNLGMPKSSQHINPRLEIPGAEASAGSSTQTQTGLPGGAPQQGLPPMKKRKPTAEDMPSQVFPTH